MYIVWCECGTLGRSIFIRGMHGTFNKRAVVAQPRGPWGEFLLWLLGSGRLLCAVPECAFFANRLERLANRPLFDVVAIANADDGAAGG